MLDNIELLCHSSIRINKEKIIYIDPYKIEKKYNDAETTPDLSAKKYPVNIAIIGNFALHGINGVSIIDSSLSLLSFIILVDIIAGTLHPKSNYKWH